MTQQETKVENALQSAPCQIQHDWTPFKAIELARKLSQNKSKSETVVKSMNLNKQSIIDRLRNVFISEYPLLVTRTGRLPSDVYELTVDAAQALIDEVNAEMRKHKAKSYKVSFALNMRDKYTYLKHVETREETIPLVEQVRGTDAILKSLKERLERLQKQPAQDKDAITKLQKRIYDVQSHYDWIHNEFMIQRNGNKEKNS